MIAVSEPRLLGGASCDWLTPHVHRACQFEMTQNSGIRTVINLLCLLLLLIKRRELLVLDTTSSLTVGDL